MLIHPECLPRRFRPRRAVCSCNHRTFVLFKLLNSYKVGDFDESALIVSLDLYGYVENQPTNLTDPYGLFDWNGLNKDVQHTVGLLFAITGGAEIVRPPETPVQQWLADAVNSLDDSDALMLTFAAVHGNSKSCTKVTSLYSLWDNKGNFLKWGITSAKNIASRYGGAAALSRAGLVIKLELQFPNRASALECERILSENSKGKLNNEPWAGKGPNVGKYPRW